METKVNSLTYIVESTFYVCLTSGRSISAENYRVAVLKFFHHYTRGVLHDLSFISVSTRFETVLFIGQSQLTSTQNNSKLNKVVDYNLSIFVWEKRIFTYNTFSHVQSGISSVQVPGFTTCSCLSSISAKKLLTHLRVGTY